MNASGQRIASHSLFYRDPLFPRVRSVQTKHDQWAEYRGSATVMPASIGERSGLLWARRQLIQIRGIATLKRVSEIGLLSDMDIGSAIFAIVSCGGRMEKWFKSDDPVAAAL